jgi:hypothetical protein
MPTSIDTIASSPSPPPSAQWYFHPSTNNTYMQSLDAIDISAIRYTSNQTPLPSMTNDDVESTLSSK